MRAHSQISLRQVLFLVLFVGLGLAALRAGGVIAWITTSVAILMTMCFGIIAFVARDTLRAFAIGFLVPVVVYAATVMAIGPLEFDPYEAKLPTSRLLLPLFQAMSKQTWTDISTGKVVPDYDPANDPARANAGGTAFGSSISLAESPDRATFMTVGHILIAMLLGYAGAHFAVFVHRHQDAQD